MKFIKNDVLNEEERRKSLGSSSHLDVLFIEDRGKDKIKNSRNKGKSRSKSMSGYEIHSCYHCGNNGHIKRFCNKLKQEI